MEGKKPRAFRLLVEMVLPQTAGSGRSTTRLCWYVFTLVFVVYLVTASPPDLNYDGQIMYQVTQSLALRHSFQIVDPIFHLNQPYSPYGLAVSILIIPLFVIGSLFQNGMALIGLFQPAISALTVIVLLRLLVEHGVDWRRSVALSFIYAFATVAWHYSGVLFSEPLVGLCLTGSMLALTRFVRTNNPRAILIAGTLIGVSIVARPDSLLLIAVPLSAYVGWLAVTRALRAEWLRLALAWSAPIGAGGALDMLYNIVRYGSPLQFGYLHDAIGFSHSFAVGIVGLLVSPGVGLFVYMPVLLLALLGFRSFARRYPVEALTIGALCVLRIVFYAGWWAWDGWNWGPRFLLPMVPLLFIPLAFVRWRGLMAVTGGAMVVWGLAAELLVQLEPWDLYWAWVSPATARDLGLTFCNCFPTQSLNLIRVKEYLDFNVGLSPLAQQLALFLHGHWHPRWDALIPLMPLLAAGTLAAGCRTWQATARLARSESQMAARTSHAA